ncbi:polyprenyl synthetase family protein [Nitrosopumilus sp. b2]|uniref:polyprenyl synthetase family protein n=1 Tax=Nitrosopumilus sp. b2 TaxID=2109908 RepID=UPI0015F73515|nr:polyprenyl synthetase family protein [Nitrosopumilus sp. b2]KAF6244923.1 hypothetical protein C6989_05960 [Nitrosopumilus sp. b2]
MINSIKLSKKLKNLIFSEITKILEIEIKHSSGYNILVKNTYENISRFISRSISLGPILSLMIYHDFSKEISQDIIKIGVALEFFTYSILLHDDIIDNDQERWNGKSFHIIVKDQTTNTPNSQRVGKSVAILAGNLLSLLAFEIISNTKISDEKKSKIMHILSEEYRQINEGQLADLQFETQFPNPKAWYNMASQRASRHISACVRIGAVLGNTNGSDEKTLKKLSNHLGYFFDIRDDLLDGFSRKLPKTYSKRDIKMGKKPLYVCYSIDNSTKIVRQKIMSLLLEKNNIGELTMLLRKYGLPMTLMDLHHHKNKVLELVGDTTLDKQTKEYFYYLLEKSIKNVEQDIV